MSSDLFKEMCALSGKLNDLIDKTKDIDERQVLELLQNAGIFSHEVKGNI